MSGPAGTHRTLAVGTASGLDTRGPWSAMCRGRRQQLARSGADPDDFERWPGWGEEVALEIEDLLPVAVLMRFYEEHPELMPQERHWCNGYWRLVPSGTDKEALAQWISTAATVDDMDAFLYLLCVARSQIGLPIPSDALTLEAWEQSLRVRQVADRTVGLLFRTALRQ